jgi:hypothetical protein
VKTIILLEPYSRIIFLDPSNRREDFLYWTKLEYMSTLYREKYMSHMSMSQACLLNFLPVKQCVKTLENLNVDVGLCCFYLELELELMLANTLQMLLL